MLWWAAESRQVSTLGQARARSAAGLVLLMLVAARAGAEESDAEREVARSLANDAADAIARGDHLRGEELLRRANELYPAPTISLLHARTLTRLGRLAQAVTAYERASNVTMTESSPEAFVNAAAAAQRELALLKPRVPRLQVSVAGAAAHEVELSVDGKSLPVEQVGRWLLVDPGTRSVRARRGDRTSERTLQLEERQSAFVELELEQPTSTARWLTIGALGVGVLGTGVGVVSGLVAGEAHERASAGCPERRCVEGSEGATQLRTFRQQRAVSTVGYAVGAGGLALGGFLLLRGAFDGERLKLDVDVASRPQPGGGS